MRFIPLGDTAVTVTWLDDDHSIDAGVFSIAMANALRAAAQTGVLDVTAAFGEVTVVYHAASLPCRDGTAYQWLCGWIRQVISSSSLQVNLEPRIAAMKTHEIQVRYGGCDGPDMAELADKLELNEVELIGRHSSCVYRVVAVGFMPGFAYLGGLPVELHAPRRASPRTRVTAGSVAIGGRYTGVYPFASPGGWNIIGRTSIQLFDPSATNPARFSVGDTVRFQPC